MPMRMPLLLLNAKNNINLALLQFPAIYFSIENKNTITTAITTTIIISSRSQISLISIVIRIELLYLYGNDVRVRAHIAS